MKDIAETILKVAEHGWLGGVTFCLVVVPVLVKIWSEAITPFRTSYLDFGHLKPVRAGGS